MELIVSGGILFWIVVAAICSLMVVGIEEESNIFTGGVLITGFALLWFFTGFHALDLSWITHNWGFVLAGILAYVITGVLWGGLKWWFFLHNKADVLRAEARVKNPSYADDRQYTTYKDYVHGQWNYPPLACQQQEQHHALDVMVALECLLDPAE